MNWEAIGAIGEMVGAGGVIMSLVYLAIQIRQGSAQTRLNTKAIQATAFQNLVEHQSTLYLNLTTNREHRALILKAGDAEMHELADQERIVYGSFTRMIIRSYFNAYNLLKDDLITTDQWKTLTTSVARETNRKAFREFWRSAREDFPPDFADVIDRSMKKGSQEL